LAAITHAEKQAREAAAELPVAHHDHVYGLAHHFDDMEQQREAGTLGMWTFLVTEIMFFGGMFLAYAIYRSNYPEAFAIASHSISITLGATNTVVLIVSSLTMALAVYYAQLGERRKLMLFLVFTMLLGLTFLGIKAVEYYDKYAEHHIPGANFYFPESPDPMRSQMFFVLYFAMTGVHALHMVVGIGILSVLLYFAWRGKYTPGYHSHVELSGLYWHFVDIVWIFLFPLLYLIGRHVHQ
jgi:cytochrome c oxidase subunit 3